LARGFQDQAGEIEGAGEGIANGHGFVGIGETKEAGMFEQPARLNGIAGFGVGLPAHAEMPGFGTDLGIAGEAGGTIGEGQTGGKGKPEGVFGKGKRAGGTGKIGRSPGDVRSGLVEAFLAANPFGGLALVVVAVAEQVVTVGAEGDTIFVKAAFQTGIGLVIAIGMANTDGAQGVQFVVDKLEDFGIPFTGITEQFADFEVGKPFEQSLNTGDGE